MIKAKLIKALLVIAIVLMVTHMLGSTYIAMTRRDKLPHIRVSASRGNPEEDKLGELIWTVYGRWERDVVTFYDYGLDGTLDLVEDPNPFVESNSLDWKVWTERYCQIRQEYITGKKPDSPQ